ncbi:hypothetical protein AB6A40_008477 [Gnathostoma spinigerum]|uniref:RGS domain-containing protein n=1 Tax=Gnathostoma spinigerum TaxID=75299 RepID=A0ABD6EPH5_9BILA
MSNVRLRKRRFPRSRSMPVHLMETPQQIFHLIIFKCRSIKKMAVTAIIRARRGESLESHSRDAHQSSAPVSPVSASKLSQNEWTAAFNKVLNDAEGRNEFADFLRSEYSEENILFW